MTAITNINDKSSRENFTYVEIGKYKAKSSTLGKTVERFGAPVRLQAQGDGEGGG